MDNKNQNNDGVEDDFNNLSSEESLNESQESSLNKSDLFDEQNINVSDFSVVKDGFRQNFIKKQPPKFIWDKIEQELESTVTSDDVSEFSTIKSGFEESFKKIKLPGLTWGDLEEEMDNPSPDNSKDDYSFLKSGFEQQYSGIVLPLFSWDDLANRMDNEAVNSDSAENYSIVKESFDDQFMKLSNPVRWSELNARLERDTIRGKIEYQFARFRKNIMKAGVVALLLLLCKTCVYDNISTTNPEGATFATYQVAGTDKNKTFTENEENPAISKSKNTKEDKKPFLQPAKKNKNIPVTVNSEEKINKAENSGSSDKVDLSSVGIAMMGGNRLEQFHVLPPSLSIALINNLQSISFAFSESSSKNYLNRIGTETEAPKNPALLNDLALSNTPSDNKMSGTNKQNKYYKSFPYLDILPLSYLDAFDITSIEPGEIEKVEVEDNYKSIVFEFGLIGKFGTGMLLGKTASDALESKSLSTTKMNPSGGIGIMINCFFSKNDAVVLTAIPHSEVQQSFGNFTRSGNYLITELKLSYFDLTVGYQRNLINFNKSGLSSGIYTRLDFGVGILTNGETKINNEIIANENSFNNYNLNLGLSLGSAHQFNHFVFDYGITGNVGVASIINTSSNQTLTEPANLLNIGGYISVRYAFSSQYKVSGRKKNSLQFHKNH
jgi:hypothetical protein